MSSKDKRIKGCPEPGCERHDEHYKYKPTDNFCTICGSQLVFVCAKCFEEIEDTEDKHRYCENCKPVQPKETEVQKPAKEKKKKEKKPKEPGKSKEAVAKSVAVIKGKAPEIKERAIQIASDPNVQRAALEVADIAKYGIKHRKTRRIVGALIRAAKK